MRLTVLLSLLLAAGAASGQAGATDYLLNPGDALRVSVWKETELQRDLIVQPDGSITYPLVGTVPAAGRAPGAVQNDIAQRIDRFIPGAVVTVELVEAKGNMVFVLGEVTKPGGYQLGGPISVVQAISLAGGFTPFASTGRVRVLRGQGEAQKTFSVDYDDVARGRDLASNIELKAGDTVIIPGGSLF